MQIHTEKEPGRAAALAVMKELEAAAEENETGERTPLLLLLSGGSSLEVLRYLDDKPARNNVTITVLDERFSNDPHVNNFAQLSRSNFFRNAQKNGAHAIDTRPRQGESMKALAERFEQGLKAWRTQYPEGRVVAVIGIGTNGHIAGIMPHDETGAFLGRFEDQDIWVTAYRALPSQTAYVERVTTTLSYIRFQIDHSIVFVVGEEKKDALEKIFSQFGMLSEVPGRILQSMEHVDIYTDLEKP